MPIEVQSLGPMRAMGPVQKPSAPSVDPGAAPAAPPTPFTDRLSTAVQQVNALQQGANTQAELIATGQTQDLQQAVVAIEKADLALELTVQVTQKAVQAYQEISRLQV